MIRRAFSHTVRYLRENALAAVALFVALGGTGYAAAGLHTRRDSTSQPLKPHGQVVAWAVVKYNGHVIAGGGTPRVQVTGTGAYTVRWRKVPTFPKRKIYCAAPVTVDSEFSGFDFTPPGSDMPEIAGYADVNTTGHVVYVQTFSPLGQPASLGFEVAMICPGA